MKVKLVKDAPEEKVYAVIFYKGDDAMSGLTDFAIQNKIEDAHFTAIGAINGATLAWLDPAAKIYHRIPVTPVSYTHLAPEWDRSGMPSRRPRQQSRQLQHCLDSAE